MKNLGIYNKLTVAVLGVILSTLFVGCNREEDELPKALFPDVGAIFTNDSFIGLGTNFFFPFVSDGAKPDVFSVSESVGYVGTSSIRIDVPDADDPGGSFAGATYIIDGYGRNLTQYTALTFWAQASESTTISEFGFGANDVGSQYLTSITNLRLTPGWKKYIIPIPDPSKLVNEKGMMWFAASGACSSGDGECFPENPNGGTKKGYTFWLDEIKFENLGTIGQATAQIQNGEDAVVAAFVGQVLEVSGVNVSFNMPNGIDEQLNTTSAFFNYETSNPGVVSTAGSIITVVGEGTTTVTATMGDVAASGSLTIQTISEAPEPTRNPSLVTSIFSDRYENQPVDFFNGFFFGDGQTTTGGAVETAPGKNIINYSNLNFVIAEFKNPTIDVSDHTHMHIDIFTFDDTEGAQLDIGLGDFGSDNGFGGGDDGRGDFRLQGSGFKSGEWISLDIRLEEFRGLNNTANLAQLIFVSDQIDNLLVDNIYFYSESPAQDASLSNIFADGLPINGFGSGILNYQVAVPTGSSAIPQITAVTNNEDAQVSITQATALPGTATIEVIAANSVTTQTYTVEFFNVDILGLPLDFESDEIAYPFEDFGGGVLSRIDNPDASGINTSSKVVEMVKFSGEPFAGSSLVLPGPMDFSEDRTFKMKVWVPKADVTVLLKVEDSNNPANFFEAVETTTVANAWEELVFDFSGINTSNSYDKFVWIFENGTVGDGTANFTYYFDDIELFTDATTDATLSDLQANGSTIDGFSPSTLTYDVVLPQGTTEIPEVAATANNSGASVEITDASALPGTASIVVTAADGVTTSTYTINFTVFSPGADATLSDLHFNGTTVPGFSASTLDYSVELPEGTSTIPTVTATAAADGATSDVTQASALPGTATVVVTAEDGTTQNTYTIAFTVASSIVELIKNGGFDTNGDWTGNAFNIQEDGGSRFNFANVATAGNAFDVNLSQTVTLVPGEDYTLTFEASTSPETGSRTMVVGIGQSGDPFFANTETVTLTAQTQTFTLNLTAVDDGTGSEFGDATSRVLFDMGADVGVIVIDNVSLLGAGSGNPGSSPSLSDLQVDGSTIAGFSAATTSYTVELPTGTTTVPTVTATASDGSATVVVTDATALPGATTVSVSANGQQTTYTVSFTVAAGPVELIKNGGFDTDGDWTGNAFNIQEDGGSRFNFADVASAGNSFDVNMSQTVTLVPGASYTLTFEASTSPERVSRTMVVGIGQSADPFFANIETVTLTAQTQTFTLDLEATDDGTGSDFGDATSRVLFDMGADTGVVVIDNVSLMRK